jgi:hypothetical protein
MQAGQQTSPTVQKQVAQIARGSIIEVKVACGGRTALNFLRSPPSGASWWISPAPRVT